ncbi:beta-1,3-galactosyl-O-glycosyl-glycoprotein beta-1,6-N-acetylglucosaminyltransferase-like isoform X2 [Littorina saxatilis]|uniref:beta-1,3-galactosyl-O-glycosyl-glycoprotein beta-1,6-N-acetylglucosaminyltransferase-like isoform X2 n=1 Tax=Littorina saxatilis TaxID=31220 RepID=UPI0038B60620
MAFMRASKLWRFLLLVCVIAVITLAYVTNYSDGRVNILPSSSSYLDKESGPVVLDAEKGFVVANRTMQMEGGAAHTLHDLYLKAKDRAESKRFRSEVGMRIPVGGAMWRDLKSLIKKAESESFPWTPSKESHVDCSKLLAGDGEELNRTNRLLLDVSVSETTISEMAAVCPQFRQRLGFITSPLTEEEREFPIAFSILTFKDAEQVLNLLRAIYRPQNFYCIHVDKKSSKEYRDAIVAISKCFDNVFLASRSVDVKWGQFSVLEPELVCMEDLWRHKAWKYFINLTGQEFPLRTNFELVRILKAFNGANSLEGTRKRSNPDRWESAGKPPGGIEPVKGSVHVTVNRDFVDFVLHNETGQAFLNWSRHVDVPDETFFSSLNHSPHLGIRGAYIGESS